MDLNRFNPRQREAITHVGSPLLVLAGAGSGKTSVITHKIAWLIQEAGIPARHITAVTFTNKASREMRERIGNVAPKDQIRGLTVSTFHTFGLNLLRREAGHAGLKSGFSILDAEDAKSVLADLLKRESIEDRDIISSVQHTISNWKNDGLSPGKAQIQACDPQSVLAASAYVEYDRYLKACNAVDFDDLILRPVELFRSNPDLLAKWQSKIRYLLVDEYQDTNGIQYELVKLLTQISGALTIVGDDDQSIYAWRGARPENLNELSVDFPTLKVIKLEQNYRSTRIILETANTLIANNPHIFEKTLWSDKGFGDRIEILPTKTDEDEAERIASMILERRLNQKRQFSDFAVLYRSNHQARILEFKLQHFKIPYKLSGGTSFFARSEIRDLMSYLRLLINPDDDNALLRIIIGPTTLEVLGRYAHERHQPLYACIPEMGLTSRLDPEAARRLAQFYELIETARRDLLVGQGMHAIDELLEGINYRGWLSDQSSSEPMAERRWGNVMQLLEALRKDLKSDTEEATDDDEADSDDTAIEAAIRKLVLRDILEREEEEDDSDRVQLATLHAAKGLEFPDVFLMGVEEELLPHKNSVEADTIEEERRLMYVGITRAKQNLTVTYAKRRKQFGEFIETIPSRFLDELPEEHIHWHGKDEIDPEMARQKGQDTLSALHAMLKGESA
ncbi:MAG: ATP-dependent DNA helicase Rep [Gammaproteobacteria bacterium]|nr:ATP-dependent DNA helicase Rep [Gammaproteobacteria bacterium]